MKINILLALSFVLAGCSTTVPIVAKFPDVPSELMIKCPQLQKLGDEPKISEITKTVTSNYNTYYECSVKNDAWIEWYHIQKKIFEGVK